jgi:hypothetical protein
MGWSGPNSWPCRHRTPKIPRPGRTDVPCRWATASDRAAGVRPRTRTTSVAASAEARVRHHRQRTVQRLPSAYRDPVTEPMTDAPMIGRPPGGTDCASAPAPALPEIARGGGRGEDLFQDLLINLRSSPRLRMHRLEGARWKAAAIQIRLQPEHARERAAPRLRCIVERNRAAQPTVAVVPQLLKPVHPSPSTAQACRDPSDHTTASRRSRSSRWPTIADRRLQDGPTRCAACRLWSSEALSDR